MVNIDQIAQKLDLALSQEEKQCCQQFLQHAHNCVQPYSAPNLDLQGRAILILSDPSFTRNALACLLASFASLPVKLSNLMGRHRLLDQQVLSRLAANDALPPALYSNHLLDPSFLVRVLDPAQAAPHDYIQGALSNPRCPRQYLQQYCHKQAIIEKGKVVHNYSYDVLSNPNCPQELLAFPEFKAQQLTSILRNPNCPPQQLIDSYLFCKKAVFDKKSVVNGNTLINLNTIFNNLSCPQTIIEDAWHTRQIALNITKNSASEINLVLKSPSLSRSRLRQAWLTSQDQKTQDPTEASAQEEIQAIIENNSNCPPDILINALLVPKPNAAKMLRLARHQQANATILLKLIGCAGVPLHVKAYALLNPNAPLYLRALFN